MDKINGAYTQTMTMRSLISDNASLLTALARFDIPLGFGDKTVVEVCREKNIDSATFLAVANYISGRSVSSEDINLEQLMAYLKRAHDYFLDFKLPLIRRKLLDAIDITGVDSIGFLILKFYDDFVQEVRAHMEAENDHVFPFVESLLERQPDKNNTIGSYASGHTAIAPKLHELKDIIVRYYPGEGNNLLTSVLFDILTCEQDLKSHCEVEDDLFVPAVKRLESEIAAEEDMRCADCNAPVNDDDISSESNSHDASASDAERVGSLSDREKEIICLISKGLTNKEIASQLFLSVHTVATHRRNITSKLNIHSPAGLTIFAIINGLISINDISRSSIG